MNIINSSHDANAPSNHAQCITKIYNTSFSRLDNWNLLKVTVSRLNKEHQSETKQADAQAKVTAILKLLKPYEMYWAFPGRLAFHKLDEILKSGDYKRLEATIRRIVRSLMSNSYRRNLARNSAYFDDLSDFSDKPDANDEKTEVTTNTPYFEVLIVDDISIKREQKDRLSYHDIRSATDPFQYEPLFVRSYEDAVICSLINYNVQAVVIRYDFKLTSEYGYEILKDKIVEVTGIDPEELPAMQYATSLASLIKQLRPELDIYLVTDQSVEEIARLVTNSCRRIFYNQEDYLESHLNIMRGVEARYNTPFFNALKKYSQQPMGVFHAMPISRGKSITKSHWIKDMGEFYGMNTFLAETSSTSGGLDSLLDPTGPIKEAQELASRAFGSRHTFFATNGTSTCNKIVVQAIVQPGDIVLVDRDCHKSHHYGMVLAGAEVVYLDSYPLSEYSMYGAVPLEDIKRTLLQLKAAGKLDRVRMLLLTNCTFDGLIYNVKNVMQQCLAIKPDLVFLWDEAWFAFARFDPIYRQRTGMHNAQKLRDLYRSDAYLEQYQTYKESVADIDENDVEAFVHMPMMADPEHVRVRVYSTQSTHKTLTSLRQGSMIHVFDQDYSSLVEESFHEAYMTHTSTSPNYQILASLDIGRRQVELEGFELVQKQIEMASILREQIRTNPRLNKYFKVLGVEDMIPEGHRQSATPYYEDGTTCRDMWHAWGEDEFVLDATRITLGISKFGVDGDTFKNEFLMDKHGIQLNKTSRNTVLFMTNIGTTRSSIAYLIEVLVQLAEQMDEKLDQSSRTELMIHEKKVYSLEKDLPLLPDFSYFHEAFKVDKQSSTPEGKIRSAFFLSYKDQNCEYISIHSGLDELMDSGREVVSAGFVTPYPPGFPILVPGQVVSHEILDFMRKLDVKEIHGYREELGLRVFTVQALQDFKL